MPDNFMVKNKTDKPKVFCAISFNVHDSSVSFAIDEKVVLVLEAERFFRVKKKVCSKKEMEELIKYGLSNLKIELEDVKYWTMTTLQNPHLTTDDIFESDSFISKEPYWKQIEILGKNRDIFIVNHHLSHAATYLLTEFENAIIISCDGGGDYNPNLNHGECFAAFQGNGITVKRINQINVSNAINAKFYGACSFFLYKQIYKEGKMMALAAYGISNQTYYDKLKSILPQLGTLVYTESVELLKTLFPNIHGREVSELDPDITAFAASAQNLFSDYRVKDIYQIASAMEGESQNLVLAGGACLNLDSNTEILKSLPNMNHFIASCCDDTGQSLGAICILISEILKKRPSVKLPYLGTGENHFDYDIDSINSVINVLLNDGIVILHNGKSEVGPRALGNRSFIARPDKLKVKKYLSEEIKQRENYRPVAPVVLQEKVDDYFIENIASPFMLYKYAVKESVKVSIAGAIHCDGSARVQTVNRETNEYLYELITEFGNKTGIYMLLNTSLNFKGNPISNSINDTLEIYSKIQAPKCLVYNGRLLKVNEN
ncbi:MAG: carbamoyltransferase C-terminal domain-containing protein [bacterium]